MSLGYFKLKYEQRFYNKMNYQADDFYDAGEWEGEEWPAASRPGQIGGISLVGLALLLVMLFVLFGPNNTPSGAQGGQMALASPPAMPQPTATLLPPAADPAAIAAPYPDYVITQGPHGTAYGHYAIDLTAGKGATIYSPINGQVTLLYTDQYGNPTLIIENTYYQVTLMHGDYTVSVGQMVALGDPVGQESNHGYTLDWLGRLCTNRDCGYHTHLNIFDKRLGSNVNPLELIES